MSAVLKFEKIDDPALRGGVLRSETRRTLVGNFDTDTPELISDDEADALARTIPNLFNRWELSDQEACTLLGGISRTTWARWKKGNTGRIDRDLRMRMAHLIGIHIALRILFRNPEDGYTWLKEPNNFFDGKTALEVMLRGELDDIAFMREWLGAEVGI